MPRTKAHPYNVSMQPIAQKIERSEEKRGVPAKKARSIAFGALNNMGAKHGNVTTKKGEAMMDEHKVKARGQLEKYERRITKRRRKESRKRGSKR